MKQTAAVQDALNRFNQRRVWLRDALKNHQPFLLLASLSFVIAAFLRNTDAAGFAALAALAFLLAMFFSVRLDSLRTPDLTMVIVFYASLGYGFVLLAIDAIVILLGVPGAVLGIVFAGSILVLGLGVVALTESIWMLRQRLAKTKGPGP